jgi:hypothetical protein
MGNQWFGKARRLNPPLLIDGRTWSLTLMLEDPWANRTEGASSIVSGVIERRDDLGGGLLRIVCRRDWRFTSNTEVFGAGSAVEVITRHLCGGNIAATPEPLRIYSWIDPTGARGSDGASRALSGDALRVAGRGRWFTARSTDAMAVSPIGGVDWQGGEPFTPPVYWDYDVDVEIDPEESELLLDGEGALEALEVVAASGPPPAETVLSRKVFDAGFGPDPDWYPDDAEFDGGSAYQYWADPSGLGLRFSSNNFNIYSNPAGDIVRARFWLVGELEYEVAAGERFASLPSGTAGYGSAGDTICGASFITRGDFDETWSIRAGAGSAEWRRPFPTATNPRLTQVAVIRWTVNGLGQAVFSTLSGGARIDPDGAWFDWPSPAATYNFPFEARITKVGGLLTWYHRQNSAAPWTPVFGVTPTGLTVHDDGVLSLVGAGTDGAQGEGATGAMQRTTLADDGRIGVWREEEWTGVKYSRNWQMPTAETVLEVYNLTTKAAMSVAVAAIRRDTYSIIGNVIYLYSETAGDRIRVTQEAPAGPGPAAPGNPPRVFNITRAADGGSDPDNNRMNWHDEIVIEDTDGVFDGVAGEAFEIRRWAKAMVLFSDDFIDGLSGGLPCFRARFTTPTGAPTIEYDVKGKSATDWAVVPASEVRFAGASLRQACGWAATTYNEMARALEVADEWWTSAGLGLGFGYAMAGLTLGCRIVALDYSGTVPVDPAIGTLLNDISPTSTGVQEFVDLAVFYGKNPFWLNGGPLYGGGTGWPYLNEMQDGSLIYTSQYVWDNYGQFGQFQRGIEDWWSMVVPGISYVGNMEWGAAPDRIAITDYYVYYQFHGYQFGNSEKLGRMLEGCEIVEAKGLARFDGLNIWEWEETHDGEGGIQLTVDQNSDAGDIGFNLVGRRRRTGSAFIEGYPPPLIVGSTQPIPADDFAGFGGVSLSSMASGLWKPIDLTNVIAALASKAALDSEYGDFMLWPTAAALPPGSPVAEMRAYLITLMPVLSGTYTASGIFQGTVSGRKVTCSGYQVRDIYVRFRLPTGEEVQEFLPIQLPSIPF